MALRFHEGCILLPLGGRDEDTGRSGAMSNEPKQKVANIVYISGYFYRHVKAVRFYDMRYHECAIFLGQKTMRNLCLVEMYLFIY